MSKMNAAVLHGIDDLRYEKVDIPELGDHDVLVKVKACGICGSDIPRVLQTGTYHFPTIPGHEFGGIVVKAGSQVKNGIVGKKVAVIPLIPCRECKSCEVGDFALCENYDFLGSRNDGGFAEYVKVPYKNLVVVPENVTSIDGAFYGCESLEQVSLPKNIVSLCYAFNCCFTLEHIDLPPALKDASWAFECTRIKNIELPNSIENISRAFMSCEHLECVHIPATVIDLTEAFSDCENLTEVVLEDGITNIGDYAFFNCTSLKELTIPESVTDFGEKSVGMMEIREYVSSDKSGYQIKGYQKIPSFVIKGKAGSEAEKYAKKHRIDFVKI